MVCRIKDDNDAEPFPPAHSCIPNPSGKSTVPIGTSGAGFLPISRVAGNQTDLEVTLLSLGKIRLSRGISDHEVAQKSELLVAEAFDAATVYLERRWRKV